MAIPRRDDNLIRQITDRLREIRKTRGLTQTAVYEDTGIHIGKIESTQTNLSISAIAMLCRYYEISLEEFFKGLE